MANNRVWQKKGNHPTPCMSHRECIYLIWLK